MPTGEKKEKKNINIKALKKIIKESHETTMNILELMNKDIKKQDEESIYNILKSISEDYNISYDDLTDKYLSDNKDKINQLLNDNNKLQEISCNFTVINDKTNKLYVNKNEDGSNVYKNSFSEINIVGKWDVKNSKIIFL